MNLAKCSKCYDTLSSNILNYYRDNFFKTKDDQDEKNTKIMFKSYGGYLCEKHLLQCSRCEKTLTKTEINLYHDSTDNIKMEIVFLSNKGYLCNLCMLKCSKCYKHLTEKELQYFDENPDSGISNTLIVCEGYVCKKHWCECMPKSTPWSYLRTCGICENNYICKTCKYITNSGITICEDCNNRLKN